jgi:hypothetical protein
VTLALAIVAAFSLGFGVLGWAIAEADGSRVAGRVALAIVFATLWAPALVIGGVVGFLVICARALGEKGGAR